MLVKGLGDRPGLVGLGQYNKGTRCGGTRREREDLCGWVCVYVCVQILGPWEGLRCWGRSKGAKTKGRRRSDKTPWAGPYFKGM